MATWTTRSHDWQREDWTRPESDYPESRYPEESRYPNPTPARVAFARGLGVVGILASLALAAYAFAPRSQELAGKAHAAGSRLVLPWDPKLEPGPAPLPLDRYTPAPSLAVRDAVAAVPATSAEPLAPPAAPEPAPAGEPLIATPPLDPTAEAQPGASPSPEAEPSRPEAESQAVAPEPNARRSRPAVRRTETSPGFTPEEIQRRKDRYEAWLKEQGLERIH
jgi:hypothetical protein